MQELESVVVAEERVACDGGEGTLGHPRVWLNMRGHGEVSCPYCGRHFVLVGHEGDTTGKVA